MRVFSFKTAWRNLVRHKTNTIINTGGLILGFIVGLAVMAAVIYQLQFDKFHVKGDRLFAVYNVYQKSSGVEYGNSFGYPAGPTFQKEISAVESMSRFLSGSSNIRYNNHELNLSVMLVDTGFAEMFSFPAKQGDLRASLQQMNGLAITETAAKKLFGNEPAIGKKLLLLDGEKYQEHIVTALLQDPPAQSSVRFQALARIETRAEYPQQKDNWNFQTQLLFIMLKKDAPQATAEAQLRAFNHRTKAESFESLKKEGALKDKNGDEFATLLQPVKSLHFASKIDGHSTSYAELMVLAGVGLMIILIACFNFININLAQAFLRTREIGVRKCLGAGKFSLIAQLWSESFLVCGIAFLLSTVGLYFLIDQLQANGKFNIGMGKIFWSPAFLIASLLLLILVSLIAGGYPSWIMSRFQVVESLKGKINQQGKHRLRNGLIIFQFVIACIMISCTLVVYRQFQHLQSADLGINQDYVISVPLQNGKNGRDIIHKVRQRLANHPGIKSISGSSINIGRGRDRSTAKSSVGFDFEGKQISTNISHTDYDYAKTLGITLLEGRDFDASYGNDTNCNVLLSESVARQFAGKAVVGASLLVDSSGPRWNVIGVFKDFHLYSMREETEPLTLIMDPKAGLSYCLVKTTPQQGKQTMLALEKTMKEVEPDAEFRGSFIQENIQNWYVEEKTMSQLFTLAAVLAILLSCTGLLAMVMQVTRQRVKEIGIRKVLGAGVAQISWLVSVSFLKLVLISILIALPLAWLAMHSWLEKFPYRIALSFWTFAAVAFLAMFIAAATIAFNTIKAARQNPVKSIRTE